VGWNVNDSDIKSTPTSFHDIKLTAFLLPLAAPKISTSLSSSSTSSSSSVSTMVGSGSDWVISVILSSDFISIIPRCDSGVLAFSFLEFLGGVLVISLVSEVDFRTWGRLVLFDRLSRSIRSCGGVPIPLLLTAKVISPNSCNFK